MKFKVYKNENENKRFTEEDVLAGKDIYSTSKVICEHLAECYRLVFCVNIANRYSPIGLNPIASYAFVAAGLSVNKMADRTWLFLSAR